MNYDRPKVYMTFILNPDHWNLLLSYRSIELLSRGALKKIRVIVIVLVAFLLCQNNWRSHRTILG